VLVHVSSPVRAALEHRTEDAAPWTFACDAPCDKELPLVDEYRVVFGGRPDPSASWLGPNERNTARSSQVEPGGAFRLQAMATRSLTLTLRPSSERRKRAGITLATSGVVLTALSLAGVVYFTTKAPSKCPQGGGNGGNDWAWCGSQSTDFVGMLASVAGLMAGGSLLVSGAVVGATAGPAVKQSATAFVREPTWGSSRAAPSGKPAYVPSFSFVF
jgi:hypothetical protein